MISGKKLKAAGKGLAAMKIARSAFFCEEVTAWRLHKYIDPKEGYREAVSPWNKGKTCRLALLCDQFLHVLSHPLRM